MSFQLKDKAKKPERETLLAKVETLLSLGTDAKALAPESLRLRVQQAGVEIARHYAEL